jgi:hypothetical protein
MDGARLEGSLCISDAAQNINDKIASLGFKKSKVHLSVVDAQPTLGGGVLLMVKGTITNETGSNAPSPRKFVQTFLLAQQPSGYYVRNDILRYLAEEDISAKTTAGTPPPVHFSTFPIRGIDQRVYRLDQFFSCANGRPLTRSSSALIVSISSLKFSETTAQRLNLFDRLWVECG